MRQGDPLAWDMAHGEWHPHVSLTPEDVRLILDCLEKRAELVAEAKRCSTESLKVKQAEMKKARALEDDAKALRLEMLRMAREKQAEAKRIRKSIPEQMKPLRDKASKLFREASYLSPRALSEKFEASEGTIYAIKAMRHWGTK